jgi:hypothetical protein
LNPELFIDIGGRMCIVAISGLGDSATAERHCRVFGEIPHFQPEGMHTDAHQGLTSDVRAI